MPLSGLLPPPLRWKLTHVHTHAHTHTHRPQQPLSVSVPLSLHFSLLRPLQLRSQGAQQTSLHPTPTASEVTSGQGCSCLGPAASPLMMPLPT